MTSPAVYSPLSGNPLDTSCQHQRQSCHLHGLPSCRLYVLSFSVSYILSLTLEVLAIAPFSHTFTSTGVVEVTQAGNETYAEQSRRYNECWGHLCRWPERHLCSKGCRSRE